VHAHNQPTFTTEEQTALYTHATTLHTLRRTLTDRIYQRRHHTTTLTWTAAIALCVTAATGTIAAVSGLTALHIGTACAILTAAAAGGAAAHTRRQHQHIRAEIDHTIHELDTVARNIASILPAGDTATDATIAAVLHEAATGERHDLHPVIRAERNHNHTRALQRVVISYDLLLYADTRQFFPYLHTRDPADPIITSGHIIRTIDIPNLLLIHRWRHLAEHIHHTSEPDEHTNPISHHHHIASVLHTLQQHHTNTTLDTANTLADDDTGHHHHWTDLINTAAALTATDTGTAGDTAADSTAADTSNAHLHLPRTVPT
jgi:hypothetical protein